MIPDSERGVGLWFKRMREEHGFDSARKLLSALEQRGIRIYASQYADLEAHGRMDTPRQRVIAEQVAAFYGERIPSAVAGEGSADLIAALTRQTDQMAELVKRLDALASEAIRQGVEQALRQAGLVQAAAASQSEPPPGQPT